MLWYINANKTTFFAYQYHTEKFSWTRYILCIRVVSKDFIPVINVFHCVQYIRFVIAVNCCFMINLNRGSAKVVVSCSRISNYICEHHRLYLWNVKKHGFKRQLEHTVTLFIIIFVIVAPKEWKKENWWQGDGKERERSNGISCFRV